MAKGLAVLESFDTERQRLNATLAAQRAGITRAAARRHLLTLAHLGYLETDGSYFWLAPKVLRFSGSYLASARLPRVVQPTLNRLTAQTGESFSGVVLEFRGARPRRARIGRSPAQHAGPDRGRAECRRAAAATGRARDGETAAAGAARRRAGAAPAPLGAARPYMPGA